MIQGAAFRVLYLFSSVDTLGFAEICRKAGYETDLGAYYLRMLIRDGFLMKADRGQYSITITGKHQLAITQNGHHSFVIKPRLVVALVARVGERYA